jgi:hypothetical protein
MKLKSSAPLVAYLTIAIGLFWLRSAWAALLGFHAGLLLVLTIEKFPEAFESFFKGKDLLRLVGYVLLGAGAGVTLYLAWPFMSISPDVATDLAAIGLAPDRWPVFIAYVVLVNPWIEEYFWRGYLGDPSRKLLPIDFLYAGYHLLVLYGKITWVWMLVSLLILAAVAWSWRQVSRRTGGLLIPLLSHMAADLSILMAVYLTVGQ